MPRVWDSVGQQQIAASFDCFFLRTVKTKECSGAAVDGAAGDKHIMLGNLLEAFANGTSATDVGREVCCDRVDRFAAKACIQILIATLVLLDVQ